MDDDHVINWKRIASRIRVPLEGLAFIYDAFYLAQKRIADELGEVEVRRRHCSAEEFCSAFVYLAKARFGDDYICALKSWGLDSSEKLGVVIYALVKRNLLDRKHPDCQSDFDGQFDFSNDSSAQIPGVYPYPINSLPQFIDPYRFSLRTLLIAITLVAIVLGILVTSN